MGPLKSVMSSAGNSVGRVLSLLIAFLVVSAIYLYAFPQANVLYAGVVLLHVVAGVVASVFLLLWLARWWRQGEPLVRAGMLFLFLGALPGLALIYTGALRTEWPLVYVHLALSFVGAGLIAAARLKWLPGHAVLRAAAVLGVLAVLAPVARYLRETRWTQHGRIENPALPPVSMNGEGDGPTGPFFPSSAQVYGGEKNSQQVFHGIGFLQALSRRHLQPVEQLGSPFFVVQQSVVSQVDRVHAGHDRHQAFQMVRRMPRSGRTYAGKMDTPINRSCTRPKPRPDSAA